MFRVEAKFKQKNPEAGDKLRLFLGLLFDSEDGGDMFLRIVGLSPNYTALQPSMPYYS
jgi:hypothetical protein